MYLITINSGGYSNVTKEIILKSEPFKGEHNKYHYCYEVHVPSTGWIYRGVRSNSDWSTDKYLGSSSYYSYKDDINTSNQIKFRILSFHRTRKEANIEECSIITKKFIESSKVYNMSLSDGKTWAYNRVSVKDNTGKTYSVKLDDPKYLSGELVYIHTNMISIIDETGKCIKLPSYLYNNTVHKGQTTGHAVVRNNNGESQYMSINDKNYSEYDHINEGMIAVKYKNDIGFDNCFQVTRDDPRYLSGELVSSQKGVISVKDKYGNNFKVFRSDPRLLTGELVGQTKGQLTWNTQLTINCATNIARYWYTYYNTTCGKLLDYLALNNIKYIKVYGKK